MAILIQRTVETEAPAIAVRVDRHTLYKRRWRAMADDGTELAVSLSDPVKHGGVLDAGRGRLFRIEQRPEDILAIPMPRTREMAAKVGWYLGNQHLPVEVREGEIILEDVKTLAASLDRIGIPYEQRRDRFFCKMHSHQH